MALSTSPVTRFVKSPGNHLQARSAPARNPAVHNEASKGVGMPASGQSGQRATVGGRVAAASQTLKVFSVEVTQEADTEAGSRTAVVRMPL